MLHLPRNREYSSLNLLSEYNNISHAAKITRNFLPIFQQFEKKFEKVHSKEQSPLHPGLDSISQHRQNVDFHLSLNTRRYFNIFPKAARARANEGSPSVVRIDSVESGQTAFNFVQLSSPSQSSLCNPFLFVLFAIPRSLFFPPSFREIRNSGVESSDGLTTIHTTRRHHGRMKIKNVK